MIVNAAVFTCSICGEASVNICSYCTKDACSNHRCERCKRCSDCCECEFPLSAEEPLAGEAVVESMLQPEIESPQPEAPAPEAHEPEGPEPKAPEPQAGSSWPVFPTAEEASVFADPSALVDPRPATPDSTSPDSTTPDSTTPDSTTPPQDNKPAAPRW